MFISELLVDTFRGIYFSDGDVGVLRRKFMKYRIQALAVAAPRRVEVEDDELVPGAFEEGAEGRGVYIVNFRGYAGGEGDERPHHLLAVRWMAAVQSLAQNCHRWAAEILRCQYCKLASPRLFL